MPDNLVFLLNKLSFQIVVQGRDKENPSSLTKKNEKYLKQCIKTVRQKGCDVLLGKSCEPPLEDPCVTDYGGNWSPLTLLTDYGRELKERGAIRSYELLNNSINILQEKEYDCVNDLLKFLLLLKGPFKEPSLKTTDEIALSPSDLLVKALDSTPLVSDDAISFQSETCSKTSQKRALQCVGQNGLWTNPFDSSLQIFSDASRKSLLSPEKLSLSSIFSGAKSSVSKANCQSNSYIFTDLFARKNYQSEKNLFSLSSNTYLNENPLLDSFVENPILHKLPSLGFSQKNSSDKSIFLDKAADFGKRRLELLEEEQINDERSFEFTLSNESEEIEKSCKAKGIELKRSLNCSHSFSILYQKPLCANNQETVVDSNESFMMCKDKTNGSMKGGSMNSQPTSKDIILGLWEQEHSLIQKFRPELATNYPSLRMITVAEYVEDVKYLMTGIDSNTFHYNPESNFFEIKYGTCLNDVTPESLYNFSKEFLEIGRIYVLLNLSAQQYCKNNFDTCTTITQAFWKSVFGFLELHYSVVLGIPLNINLMALKSCTRDLHEMMITMADLSKVSKPKESLPENGELLSYLIGVAEKLNTSCIRKIIFGILQNCCNVYFVCILQTWMFKGSLESQNEFFVGHKHPKMKTKTRAYYTSFYINDKKVPSFLQGFQESIFNCGKSIHFLKLFNPEDKFCRLLEKGDYPNMYLCLSDEQLEQMEREFLCYRNKVVEKCGEGVSLKALRYEEKEKENCFTEYVQQFKILQEKQRELMKFNELSNQKAKKDLQNTLLNEKIASIDSEREVKKLKELLEKKKFEDEFKHAGEENQVHAEEEKSWMRSYYDGLLKALERKLHLAESKKKNLQSVLSVSNNPIKKESSKKFKANTSDNEIQSEAELRTIDHEANIQSDDSIFLRDATSNPLPSLNSSTDPVYYAVMDKYTDKCVQSDELLNEVLKLRSMEKIKSDVDANSTASPNGTNFSSDGVLSPYEIRLVKSEGESSKNVHTFRANLTDESHSKKPEMAKFEFDVSITEIETQVEPKKRPRSDLKKGIKKPLQVAEYEIIKCDSAVISVSTDSKTQTSEESSTILNLSKKHIESEHNVQLCVKEVELDIESNADKNGSENGTLKTESSASFLSTSNGPPSNENISNSASEFGEIVILAEDSSETSVTPNPLYQSALVRDANIHSRALCQDFFNCLNESESGSTLPCTDFMKFQRFVKKSALIPLKIQEKLANDALLKHLIKGEKLLSHLKSLRGYFFLSDGEFGRSFTYNTFRSLAKCSDPKQFFERSNLSNIINEALNYTIHNCEPNSQNLSFQILKMPVILNHSCHDVLAPFELSYKVEWPLNIILTEKSLKKYKVIFRFLLKLKRINWTLNETFLFLNSNFKKRVTDAKRMARSVHYHKIQIYRHALTQVMLTFDEYIASDGLQFPWLCFLKELETARNIDHLYQKHIKYVKDVLNRCFLTKNSEELLNRIHNLIELGLKFHYTTKTSVIEVVDGKYEIAQFPVLKATFNDFCGVLKEFLKLLKEKIATNEVLKSHYVLIEKFDLKLA